MPYQINDSFFEHEIKKSRFLAYAKTVDSASDFKSWLNDIKSDWPDARHWVSCCLKGVISNPEFVLLDDDGEPSGTAAKPILNVITHQDICDVGVIIVRYFGGVKLGAGGLSRAYSTAAAGVIDNAEKKLVTEVVKKRLNVDFKRESDVRRQLSLLNISFNVNYTGQGILFELTATENQIEEINRAISAWNIESSK